MRAVIYARVSSIGQRDKHTIAAQLRDLPVFVDRMGWKLVRPVDTYVDDGRSASAGKLEAREGLTALMRDAARALFDVVVVVDLDRLTRSEDLRERGLILGAFQAAGVKIATSLSGQIHDAGTELGDLTISLGAFFAAAENRKRRERIIAGKLAAIARGRKPAGKTPYGLTHRRLPDGGAEWGLDPVRAPIVREIFERIADGETSLAISRDFNARGVVRPGSKPWSRHHVWEIAVADYPSGSWLVDADRGLAVTVPAIVTAELAERARIGRVSRRKVGLDRTKTWHIYLASQLAVCGKCGQPMRVRSAVTDKRWKKTVNALYMCRGRVSPLPPDTVRCDARSTLVKEADERIWAAICRELEDPELVPALLAIRAERAGVAGDWEGDLAGYKKHLARLEQVEAKMLERFHRGLISEAAWDKELATLKRDRDMITSQIRFVEGQRTAAVRATRRLQDAEAIVGRLREKLATATPIERREIVRTLVDPGGVSLWEDKIRLELWIERPEVAVEAESSAVALAQPWETKRDCRLRIRVVA